MIRINVVAEGQSELHFVKQVLNKYFSGTLIFDSRCVRTSTDNKLNYEYRGGLITYRHAKGDVLRWLQEDSSAYVTTMFDFFRLPTDFPEYEKACSCQDHVQSVHLLEQAMKDDITSSLPNMQANRFIPYIQLHEFEALLYTDLSVLKYDYLEPAEIDAIDRLYDDIKDIPPEEINHGAETAPSKRLLNALDYRKGESVSDLLEAITVDKIRKKCPHFSHWLAFLSDLQNFVQ